MSLLIDVTLNKFQEYLRTNQGFYWVETTKAIILIKPIENNEIVRAAFTKENPEQLQTFVSTWLFRAGATQILDFYVDGVNALDLAPKPQVTVNSQEAVPEEKEEVNKVEQ